MFSSTFITWHWKCILLLSGPSMHLILSLFNCFSDRALYIPENICLTEHKQFHFWLRQTFTCKTCFPSLEMFQKHLIEHSRALRRWQHLHIATCSNKSLWILKTVLIVWRYNYLSVESFYISLSSMPGFRGLIYATIQSCLLQDISSASLNSLSISSLFSAHGALYINYYRHSVCLVT